MDAVKAYRRRRRARMDARGARPRRKSVMDLDKNHSRFSDASCIVIKKKKKQNRQDENDVEWITTENGTHIPLKDGVAIGGPLKGKDFSGAKKAPTKKERRKQLEPDPYYINKKNGMVMDGYIAEFNRDALESIMDETGYDEEKAKELQDTLIDYLGGDFSAYTSGHRKAEEEIIDKGLELMPAYDGEIYRGMSFNHNLEDYKKFEKLCIGDEINMKSVSSWSSKEEVANNFGLVDSGEIDSVMITCKSNETGVGVQHISKWGAGEAEVLAPSSSAWKVTGKRVMSKYDYIKEFFDEKIKATTDSYLKSVYQNALEDNEYYKNENSQHNIVLLEVEEI